MSLALRRYMRAIHNRLQARRDPVAFARRLGVNLRGSVRFYDLDAGTFGSEPWLITLGDGVHITSGVRFLTHDGGTLILRGQEPTLEWTAPIDVGNDVYIGTNALILPGISIGNRVVVGAGSVVTHDIPNNSVVAGNPARVISTVDAYLDKMKQKSLRLGHLTGHDKAVRLALHYGVDISQIRD